ncbi:MAG: TfoX/Sxy family protein [Rhizobiaceae bacterium]
MPEAMADRLRALMGDDPAISEMRMFGGLCFMRAGNMQICARRDGSLLARTGPDQAPAALQRNGVSRMIMRGKAMSDYLVVDADSVKSASALREWVELTEAFVRTLPAKSARHKDKLHSS